MVKSRVGVRLKEAVGGKKSHNRREDLIALTDRYNEFTKRLRGLIESLKAHYASQVALGKTRLEVCILSTKCTKRACTSSFFASFASHSCISFIIGRKNER